MKRRAEELKRLREEEEYSYSYSDYSYSDYSYSDYSDIEDEKPVVMKKDEEEFDALEKFNQECIDIGLMDKDFISDEIPVMHCLSDMVRYQKECDTKLQAKYNELLVKSRQLEQLKADNSLDVESYEESLSAVEQELEEIRAALESARDYEIEYIEHKSCCPDDKVRRCS